VCESPLPDPLTSGRGLASAVGAVGVLLTDSGNLVTYGED